MPTPYSICFVTAGDAKTAGLLADGLVREKLAACVSVVSGVTSTYRWQDKIESKQEFLLVIKTRKKLCEDVEQFVKRKHSYATPEIIFVNVERGSREYLNWLGANTLFTTNITSDKPGKTL